MESRSIYFCIFAVNLYHQRLLVVCIFIIVAALDPGRYRLQSHKTIGVYSWFGVLIPCIPSLDCRVIGVFEVLNCKCDVKAIDVLDHFYPYFYTECKNFASLFFRNLQIQLSIFYQVRNSKFTSSTKLHVCWSTSMRFLLLIEKTFRNLNLYSLIDIQFIVLLA